MENSENQRLIQRARLRIRDAKLMAARHQARRKRELALCQAKVELLMDDLAAEGVDVNTPEGQMVFAQVIDAKMESDPGFFFTEGEPR